MKSFLLFIFVLLFAHPFLNAVDGQPYALTASFQRRDSTEKIIIKKEKIDPSRVGIVIIDMWNWHWCKTSAGRVGAMVPRMNKVLEEARKMGMQVFLCPTDVSNNYVGRPQREKALAVKKIPLPKSLEIDCPHPGAGGCMCGADECINNGGWDGMAADLIIKEQDLISSGPEELYALCKEKGITQLWYMGVHTNNCVLGKPEGMRNMMNYGFSCVLVRDLQDPETFYDPVKGITPDDNNARVVRHFEKFLAPSINFVDFLKENKLWKNEWIVDPVRITPWGKPERAHQFREKQIITFTTPHQPDVEIRYTLDGTSPGASSLLYTKPIEITSTTTLKANTFTNGVSAGIETTGLFTRLPENPNPPDVLIGQLELIEANRTRRQPVVNKSIMKGPLKIHNQIFTNGIGTQAPSFLSYQLKPEYTAFVGQCGIDDFINDDDWGMERAKYPSVIFKVFIDGKLMGESPQMRNAQWPWSFNIPIPAGSKIINLVATDAGDGSFYDYADWVNAGFKMKK